MVPLTEPRLAALGISNTTIHSFAAALQGVVESGVVAALTLPSPIAPSGRVVELSLIHIRFEYRVAGDTDLHNIWEEVDRVKGRI